MNFGLDAARASIYGTVDNQTYLSTVRTKNEGQMSPEIKPQYRLKRRYIQPLHGGVNPAADNDIAIFDPSQSVSFNFEQENGTTEWRQNLNKRKRNKGRITTIGDHLINNDSNQPALIDERMQMNTRDREFLYPQEQKQFQLDISKSRRYKEKHERQDAAWRAAHHKGNRSNKIGDFGYKYTLTIPNTEISEILKDPKYKNPLRLIEDYSEAQQEQNIPIASPEIQKGIYFNNEIKNNLDHISKLNNQQDVHKEIKETFVGKTLKYISK